MKKTILLLLILSINLLSQEQIKLNPNLLNKAGDIAQQYLIVDTHIDLPMQIYYNNLDPVQKTTTDFDYYKAVKGGLDAPFMSIYVPARYQGTETAKIVADSTIKLVELLAEEHPDKFAMAYETKDIYNNFSKGIISLPIGMENGAPVTDLDLLNYYYGKGIRYITLTHSKDNHIGDSSYDNRHTNGGLTEFGKELIKEMNNIGMIIDISHVTDETFYDVIETTEVPVIASHSSCRHFTPGFERNMSDELIILLAENGGVININFGSDFLSKDYREKASAYRVERDKYIKDHQLQWGDPEVEEFADKYWEENGKPYADITDVVDHIDYVVQLVGIDYVGIGSDYEGVGDTLPMKLKNVSMYPNLIYELLLRDYSEEEITKIIGGNFMRVWKEVENYAECK